MQSTLKTYRGNAIPKSQTSSASHLSLKASDTGYGSTASYSISSRLFRGLLKLKNIMVIRPRPYRVTLSSRSTNLGEDGTVLADVSGPFASK